jgi:hypothetical protein
MEQIETTLTVDNSCNISALERFCGEENVITQACGPTKIKTVTGLVKIDYGYVITKHPDNTLTIEIP